MGRGVRGGGTIRTHWDTIRYCCGGGNTVRVLGADLVIRKKGQIYPPSPVNYVVLEISGIILLELARLATSTNWFQFGLAR